MAVVGKIISYNGICCLFWSQLKKYISHSKQKFNEKIRKFENTEFVKTCHELITSCDFCDERKTKQKTGFLLQAPRYILDFVLFCACMLEIKSNELR